MSETLERFSLSVVTSPGLIKALLEACESYLVEKSKGSPGYIPRLRIQSMLLFLLGFKREEIKIDDPNEFGKMTAVAKYVMDSPIYSIAKKCLEDLEKVEELYVNLFALTTLNL